jgi:hypothetical protein
MSSEISSTAQAVNNPSDQSKQREQRLEWWCKGDNPRHWAPTLARHRGAKLGYRLHRSRKRIGPDNAGEFMLVHRASSAVMLGTGYTASVEACLEFVERERDAAKASDRRADRRV